MKKAVGAKYRSSLPDYFGVFLVAGIIFIAEPSAFATPCVTMTRTISPLEYTSDQPLEIQIRMESTCSESIVSFGISEGIPENWRYVSGTSTNGTAPVLWPSAGAASTLEFAWISPPTFPLEIRYVIEPSADVTGPIQFSGYGIYLFAVGNENRTLVVESTVEPMMNPEGEPSEEGEFPSEGEIPVEGEPQVEGEAPPEQGCCGKQSQFSEAKGRMHLSGDILCFGLGMMCLFFVKSRSS